PQALGAGQEKGRPDERVTDQPVAAEGLVPDEHADEELQRGADVLQQPQRRQGDAARGGSAVTGPASRTSSFRRGPSLMNSLRPFAASQPRYATASGQSNRVSRASP